MRNHILPINVVASGLLLSSVALAQPTTVKDWTLNDSGSACVASTEQKLNEQVYRFELSLDKSGVYPVEAWVREIPSTTVSKAFKLTTEVKPIQSFSFTPVVDGAGNITFWQVPTDTESLISYIKRQTRLSVKALNADGTSTALAFSLRGSSATVDALIAQCAQGKSIVRTDFEKSFVPTKVAQLDPLKVDSEKSTRLRDLYLKSVVANAQKMSLQKELATLNTQYAALIQELAKVNGSLDQLTQKELTNLQNQKAAIEARIQTLNQQLVSQQAAIGAKEAELVPANTAYEESWKVIAPIEPEHKRLAEAAQMSRSDLNRAQSRLDSLDQNITDNNAKIRVYEDEVSQMRRQLADVETQLTRARSDVQYTTNLYQRFEPRRESRDRVLSHPLARFCQQNRTDRCDNLVYRIQNEAESEVSNIRIRLSENVDYAQRVVADQSNLASQLDSRIRSRLNYDIPSLRSQNSDLMSQRPAIERSIRQLRDDVSAKTAALQSYDQQVGYAAKKADFDAKSAVVVKLRNELTSMEKEKANLTSTRDQQIKNLATTEKAITDVLTKIRAGQDRSSEISKALEPYFAEKIRIESAIGQTDALIQQNKQEFAQIINAT